MRPKRKKLRSAGRIDKRERLGVEVGVELQRPVDPQVVQLTLTRSRGVRRLVKMKVDQSFALALDFHG